MKTLKLIVIGMMLILAGSSQAQLSVRVNIGTPPSWGPDGYQGVRYYYLPDIECYYDINSSMFIYYSGNSWIHSRNLPARYRNYDLNHGYKVVMNDYHGNTPYVHFKEYRMKYAKGYRGQEQHSIGERRDNHDKGHQAVQPGRNNNQSQVRGNDKGHDPGNNKGQSHGNEKDKKDGHDNGNR